MRELERQIRPQDPHDGGPHGSWPSARQSEPTFLIRRRRLRFLINNVAETLGVTRWNLVERPKGAAEPQPFSRRRFLKRKRGRCRIECATRSVPTQTAVSRHHGCLEPVAGGVREATCEPRAGPTAPKIARTAARTSLRQQLALHRQGCPLLRHAALSSAPLPTDRKLREQRPHGGLRADLQALPLEREYMVGHRHDVRPDC